jgi:hypothetical protein|tara:strand:- start:318 stop:545 length:228 start_codon:yes stop_codon:yes gene_type:complete
MVVTVQEVEAVVVVDLVLDHQVVVIALLAKVVVTVLDLQIMDPVEVAVLVVMLVLMDPPAHKQQLVEVMDYKIAF